MLSLVAPVWLIALPALVGRDGGVSRLLMVSAFAWAIAGGVEWALTRTPIFATPLHDRFYVVTYAEIAFSTALLLFILSLITIGLTRTRWTVLGWILVVSHALANHIGNVIFAALMPSPSDFYEIAILSERVNSIGTGLTLVTVLAFFILASAGLAARARQMFGK